MRPIYTTVRQFQQSFRAARQERRTSGRGSIPRFGGLGSSQSNNSITASASTGSSRDTRSRGGFSSMVGATSGATSSSLLGNSVREQRSGQGRSILAGQEPRAGGFLVNILV